MHRTRKGTYNDANIVYLTSIGVVASIFEIAVDLEGWPALALGLQKSMVFGVICKRQKGPLPSALQVLDQSQSASKACYAGKL
jgi:hypothetical protein